MKYNINGNIAYFKARSVVKSYFQQFEVDFNQTFAAVVKSMAFKIFFEIAAFFDLHIDQINIQIAFFYKFINQFIYIVMFKSTKTKTNQEMVYKF